MAFKKFMSKSRTEPQGESDDVLLQPQKGFFRGRLNSLSKRADSKEDSKSEIKSESAPVKEIAKETEQAPVKEKQESTPKEKEQSIDKETDGSMKNDSTKVAETSPAQSKELASGSPNSQEFDDFVSNPYKEINTSSNNIDENTVESFDTSRIKEGAVRESETAGSISTATSIATTAVAPPTEYEGIPFNGSRDYSSRPSFSSVSVANPVSAPAPSPKNSISSLNFDIDRVMLPYGDGSTKIFGMENFGTTCYCNSIVQSLYFTRIFRRFLLYLPSELTLENVMEKPAKNSVVGLKPHHFLTALKDRKVNLETGELYNDDKKESKDSSSHNSNDSGKLGRRMSFFGKKNKDDKANSSRQNSTASENGDSTTPSSAGDENNNNDSNHHNDHKFVKNADGNLESGETIIYRAKSKLPGLAPLKLGYNVPHRNVTVVGVVDDPYASIDQRKRKALINGPILHIDHSLTPNKSESMFDALKDIFECMVENDSPIGVVSPDYLLKMLKRENELFRNMMHQDAHEFFNCLINSVFESLDSYYKKKKEANQLIESEKQFSSSIFEGLLVSETKCLRCERISSRDEKFIDLSIDLENNSSVTACLKQFSSNEILCEDNKFYCEYCSALQEATKRMIIKRLPKILTLHLKRFKYSEKLNRMTKLFHRVSYPLYLRLFNTVDSNKTEDKIYELYSVIVHIGGGPYHGHYVSCIKTEYSGWLLFDDETVESIDENFVLKFFGDGPGLASAYILFYQEISEEEYLNKTIKRLDLSLDMEEELAEEIAVHEGTKKHGSNGSNGFKSYSNGSRSNINGSKSSVNGSSAHLKTPDFSKKSASGSNGGLDNPKTRKQSTVSPLSVAEGDSKPKRSKSISIKSPLSNTFKMGTSNHENLVVNGVPDGTLKEAQADKSEKETQERVGEAQQEKETEKEKEAEKEEDDSKTQKRMSIFGFNKKSKSKK